MKNLCAVLLVAMLTVATSANGLAQDAKSNKPETDLQRPLEDYLRSVPEMAGYTTNEMGVKYIIKDWLADISSKEWWHEKPNQGYRVKLDSQFEYRTQYYDTGGVAVNPMDYLIMGSQLGVSLSVGWGWEEFHFDAFFTGIITEMHPKFEPTYFGAISPTKLISGLIGTDIGFTPWKNNIEFFIRIGWIMNDLDMDKNSKFPVEFSVGFRCRDTMFEIELYGGNHQVGCELTWYFVGPDLVTLCDAYPQKVAAIFKWLKDNRQDTQYPQLNPHRLWEMGPRLGVIVRTNFVFNLGDTEVYQQQFRDYIRLVHLEVAGGLRLSLDQHISFYVLYQWTWERGGTGTLRLLDLHSDSVVIGIRWEV